VKREKLKVCEAKRNLFIFGWLVLQKIYRPLMTLALMFWYHDSIGGDKNKNESKEKIFSRRTSVKSENRNLAKNKLYGREKKRKRIVNLSTNKMSSFKNMIDIFCNLYSNVLSISLLTLQGKI
jgi:hypothetical protein